MGKFTARFTQKLGPLPIWAWAAIALIAILGYMYIKKVGFFGSGSSTPAAGNGASAAQDPNAMSSLLGNQGLMPDPAAYASTGLAGGGGTGSGSNSGAFGPTVTAYNYSAGTGGTPDRGGSSSPGPAIIPAAPLPTSQPYVAPIGFTAYTPGSSGGGGYSSPVGSGVSAVGGYLSAAAQRAAAAARMVRPGSFVTPSSDSGLSPAAQAQQLVKQGVRPYQGHAV